MLTYKRRSKVSIILILILLISTSNIQVNYASENKYMAYAEVLKELNVLEGTDQGFELDRSATRLEGLILFIKLLGEQDDLLTINTFTTAFDDVPNWGAAFAEYAHAKGYTSGIGNRQFGSSQSIQVNSYVTYLMRALGYSIQNGDFRWESALSDAVKLGVYSEGEIKVLNSDKVDAHFTRGHVAYLSYLTLNAKMKNSELTLYETLQTKGKFESPLTKVDFNIVINNTIINNITINNINSTDVDTNLLNLYDQVKSNNREKEIINAYDAIDIPVSSASYYIEKPILDPPYKAGTLNADMIVSATDMVGFVRMLAYLPSVIIDNTEWNDVAQHASLTNYANDVLSHFPTQPSGMHDDLYDKAVIGAKTSNIYYGMYLAGQMELKNTIIGYMDDSDDTNIKVLGHRRWLIHPNLDQIGVGYVTDGVKTYSAIRVFDDQNNDFFNTKNKADYVAWPSAEAFPLNFFEPHTAWSVSLNQNIYDNSKIDNIKVTLKNESTGITSTFNQNELKLQSSGTQKYFNIDINGFGEPFCIIFRADDQNIKAGEIYSVHVEGIYKKDGTETELKYITRFFDM